MFEKVITETEHSETTSAITLSFLITSVVLIYFIMDRFKGRFLSPRGVELFNEYYKDNKLRSLFVDHIFILAYLSVAFLIIDHIIKSKYRYNITVSNTVIAIVVIAAVIIIFDLIFAKLVMASNSSNPLIDFFKRWASEAGYKAIVWDLIYIFSVFFVDLLLVKFNLHNNRLAVSIFLLAFLANLFM
jgi:hypothetical protein